MSMAAITANAKRIPTPVTELNIGDVVEFYGALFEIIDSGESRGHIDGYGAYGLFDDFVGPSPVAVPVGRWIFGAVVSGYFGPTKTWTFQGNCLNQVIVVCN